MLIEKMRLQWMGASAPPRMGPTAAAKDPPMPQMASARERSASRGYASRMTDIDEGSTGAADTPSSVRPSTSMPAPTARAQMSELTAKPAVPAMKARFAPKRSGRLPASRSSAANASVKPSTIHCCAAMFAWSSVPMVGSATFTMNVSMPMRNMAREAAAQGIMLARRAGLLATERGRPPVAIAGLSGDRVRDIVLT